MATKSKSRRKPPSKRPIQAPKKKVEARRVPRWLWALVTGLLIAGIATGAFLLAKDQPQSGGDGPAAATGGLPNTPDYHSLLVAPSNPEHVLLGTHAGLYESSDGGRDWQRAALEGLPSLDLHGFAVDPNDSQTLYAAVAGQGLYRSRDAGQSFELISGDVGGAVMALAVTADGRILAGDMQQGLLISSDAGKSWKPVLRAGLMGLAINPADPDSVVATGPGILLSRDGGRTWDEVLALAEGAGPVAWSPSDLDVGYAVGFDRVLYRTSDRGQSWQPVG